MYMLYGGGVGGWTRAKDILGALTWLGLATPFKGERLTRPILSKTKGINSSHYYWEMVQCMGA